MNLLNEVITVIRAIKTWWRNLTEGSNGVSIIVPFQCKDLTSQRVKNWKWLERYWSYHFPGAEIIVGVDEVSEKNLGIPFSKAAAINEAVSRAKGDVLVIVDADGYISAKHVRHCIKEIRESRADRERLWFIPYRQFYRLTQAASRRILESNPHNPYMPPTPPNVNDIQCTSGSQHGHWFGAGIQIMPREAFKEVGGWDERFRGWGGEVHAAMRAMDTLYWSHKTLPGQFLHIWHPMIDTQGDNKDYVGWESRIWTNQLSSGANDELSARYYGAYNDRHRMRKLVDEDRKKR